MPRRKQRGLRYTDKQITDAILQKILVRPARDRAIAREAELPSAAFVDALRADVIIRGVARPGPLSATEILETRGWYDEYRRRADEDQERSDREHHERGMGKG